VKVAESKKRNPTDSSIFSVAKLLSLRIQDHVESVKQVNVKNVESQKIKELVKLFEVLFTYFFDIFFLKKIQR